MTIIDPKLLAFILEMNEAFEAVLDTHEQNIAGHAPFDMRLFTADGEVSRTLEEGIELYHKEEK